MRIRKFDFDHGRRTLLEKTIKGAAGAGVLAPMWPHAARGGDVSKAYPDELLSIEMYTKGKIKPGDVITAANVEVVKDMLDPMQPVGDSAYRDLRLRPRPIVLASCERAAA